MNGVLPMRSYPHMCRDEHIEIGHADSEHELCPLCRAINEANAAAAQLAEAERHINQVHEGWLIEGSCGCSFDAPCDLGAFLAQEKKAQPPASKATP